MKIDVISGRELDASLTASWKDLQLANPELASPYFAPEFALAVATACSNVEVALIQEGEKLTAIFPFQRRGSIGLALGEQLSDYQGLICKPDFNCDPRELLKSCGLDAWDFSHLLASQECFGPFHRHYRISPLMNLSRGYEAYVAERRAAGTEQIKKCDALARRMERELGPLRFVGSASDVALMRRVLNWKSQQYLASGKENLLGGWPLVLLEQILPIQTESFGGMLSLLYAGDHVVAGHMGMRSRTVWHYWFPAYDSQFAKYSPGLVLLLKMAEDAGALGLSTIDLGMGMSLYKERLMNDSVTVASGSVILPSWLSFRRAMWQTMRAVVVKTPFVGPGRALVSGWRASRRKASMKR